MSDFRAVADKMRGLESERRLEDKLVSNFRVVAEKIRSLENERRSIMLEIEELKKLADSKSDALENEVSMLREELKSLRIMLGGSTTEEEADSKKKPWHR